MVSYGKASTNILLLFLGVSAAGAQKSSPVLQLLDEVKSGLRKGGARVSGAEEKLADACAEANLPEFSNVAKLCKELGPDGLNLGMDDSVSLVMDEGRTDGPSFNMRELLEAEDAEAAYNKIEAQMLMQTGRKLIIDYGWCSSSADFLSGFNDDSSNFCDESQQCNSFVGCGTELSSCCITHDRCLNVSGNSASMNNSRCSLTNCRGTTCDANLSTCAWNVSCCSCSWWICTCNASCVTASTGISGLFGTGSSSPQSALNPNGSDSDAICSRTG